MKRCASACLEVPRPRHLERRRQGVQHHRGNITAEKEGGKGKAEVAEAIAGRNAILLPHQGDQGSSMIPDIQPSRILHIYRRGTGSNRQSVTTMNSSNLRSSLRVPPGARMEADVEDLDSATEAQKHLKGIKVKMLQNGLSQHRSQAAWHSIFHQTGRRIVAFILQIASLRSSTEGPCPSLLHSQAAKYLADSLPRCQLEFF